MRIWLLAMVAMVSVKSWAQDRAHSPYLACAVDEVQKAKSTDTISDVQSRAAKNCEKFFDRNLANSEAAMLKTNASSAHPLPELPKATLDGIVGPKLRQAFAKLVELKMSQRAH